MIRHMWHIVQFLQQLCETDMGTTNALVKSRNMRAGDVKWPTQGHVPSFNGGAGTLCPQRRCWLSSVM